VGKKKIEIIAAKYSNLRYWAAIKIVICMPIDALCDKYDFLIFFRTKEWQG